MALDLTVAETQISVLLADDDTLSFAVTTSAGAAADITGAAFTFRVLPNQYSLDAAAVISKGTAAPLSGVTIDNAVGGLGHVTLTPADKSTLVLGTRYWYYLHMTESGGTDTTIMRGAFCVIG